MTRAEYISRINERLDGLTAGFDTYGRLREAMHYSLSAGGKRLRPMLHLMSCEMLGADTEACLDDACAIEMIHTYSLIHDDLPAMDNDDLRRGRPTNHVVFGEAFAVLAGDALLSAAYEIMLNNALAHADNLERHVQAVNVIAKGSGTGGMLAGQAADVDLEGRTLTEKELLYIHRRKTGALICAACVSGAILGGADDKDIAAVRTYGDELGMAFQITDDILDVEGTAEVLGKNPGKDQKAGKFTYAALCGTQEARKAAARCVERAEAALCRFGAKSDPLVQIAQAVALRDR